VLADEHQTVDVVATGQILHQTGQEVAVIRVVLAQRLAVCTVEVALLDLLDVRELLGEVVLDQAEDP
jgi:ABC-type amino acid transport system permease subunit